MWLRSKQMVRRIDSFVGSIRIGDETVCVVECVKNLGVVFDQCLTFEKHVLTLTL